MTIRLPHSCFIHVPRTGGLWFGELLNRITIKKQVLKGDIDSHYRHCDLPPTWKELPSFSFIRHPLDWIQSRWSHAREINAKEDGRHEGVHRLFDECVHNTFQDTVKHVMKHRPGLVSLTFAEMQTGVDMLIQTEQIPFRVYEVLDVLEGVSVAVWKWTTPVEKYNSTRTMSKWEKEFGLPPLLKNEFLEAEAQVIQTWKDSYVCR